MNESKARDEIARWGHSLFERGLTGGSSGNISARIDDGWLLTPTNVSLGHLDPSRISKLNSSGKFIAGDPPSKEALLHLAMYGERPSAGAVVHLHSTYSAAVSCLRNLSPDNCLPPLTPYFVMKIGSLPLVPYYRPGDPRVADAIRSVAKNRPAVLLANHGPIVSGSSLEGAVYAIEELEETAKLFLLLKGHDTSPLTDHQIKALTTDSSSVADGRIDERGGVKLPRFAANLTTMFTEMPFLDRFGAAADAGFKGIEFLFPYDHSPAMLGRRLRESQLNSVMFNCPAGDWANGERGMACVPGRQTDFHQSVDLAISYAVELGTRKLHVMAGVVPADVDRDVCLRTFVENLRYAAERCAREGISVLIEALNTRDMPGYLLNLQADAHAICVAVGASNIEMQMDCYHMQIQEGDLATKLRRYAESCGHVQISGVPDRHEPDKGEVNYPFILQLLDDIGYEGWVDCEYGPTSRTADDLGWFRRWSRDV